MRVVIAALSKPPEPVRVKMGKYAARATPTWALAAATRRSAAAISGRRSNKSDGRPGGISGGGAFHAAAGELKVGAGCPIKVAIACSFCERWTITSMACVRVFSS